MKQKFKYGLGIFFCGAMTLAGLSAAVETGKATNLILALVFLLLAVALIWKWPGRKSKALPKARSAAPRSNDDQVIQSIIRDSVSVEVCSSREETNEDITAADAPISYLDACALKFWNQKPTDFQVPSYYTNSTFGRNVKPALERLLGEPKYLELGSVEKSIEREKAPELKKLLASRGLKVSGKKSELIQRLIDNISKEELESIFPVRIYEITDAGQDALKYYSIVFTSEDYNLPLSYYRLLKEKGANPTRSDEDILLQLLLKDLNKADQNGQQETYRVTAEQTARFLEKTGKIKQAFGVYCAAFFVFWYRNTTEFRLDGPAEAYGYPAKSIEHCGQLCGYTWQETLVHFRECVQEINPFGLGTKRNTDLAVKIFKEALSM